MYLFDLHITLSKFKHYSEMIYTLCYKFSHRIMQTSEMPEVVLKDDLTTIVLLDPATAAFNIPMENVRHAATAHRVDQQRITGN